MKYIIGDIGNTSTKICILNYKFKIIKTLNFETIKIFKKNFLKITLKNYLNKNFNPILLFSSVVPSAFKVIKKNFKYKNFKLFEIKDFNLKKIIKINVKNQKQLGSDRIANAIGAKKYKNCLILDFGTATTFDVLIKNTYHGGVIAPGVKISLDALTVKATQIPRINLKKMNKVIGLNTISAVRAGFFWGYEGLIDNIIYLIKKETKKSFKIIVTGGFSDLFKNSIKTKVILNKDITINGLIKANTLIK